MTSSGWTRDFFDHLKSFPAAPLQPNQIFALIVVGLTLLLPILLFLFQSKLIYLPQMPPGSREDVWEPSSFGYGKGKRLLQKHKEKVEDGDGDCEDCKWEEVEIKSRDGVKLHAYWIKAPSKWPSSDSPLSENENSESTKSRDPSAPFTIIFLQANAGNIGHRLPIARKLQELIDCNVLLLSYRGYGRSTGSPSEKGIKMDAQAALDWVWKEKLEGPLEKSRVVVYGQSLGGAVSISLAHANPGKIRFLIVENSFTSIPALIPVVAPILKPFASLCTERWNSAQVAPSITQKTLLLSGERDELIPPAHMESLHLSLKRASLRKIVTFPEGTHNDTCVQPGYFEAIADFLLNSKNPPTPSVTVEEVTDEEDEI